MPFIPHATMDKDVLASTLATLVAGNTRLQFWADKLLGLRKRKTLRKLILENNFDPAAHGATEDECVQFHKDACHIRAVKGVEYQACQHVARLMVSEAKRFSESNHQTYMDQEDFEMEAYLATVDAVWGYSDPDIKFNTYVTTAIRNRFSTKLAAANPFAGRSGGNSLVGEYERTKSEMNGPANWEEVVAEMGLTDEQREILIDLQSRQYNVSDLAGLTDGFDGKETISFAAILVAKDNTEVAEFEYKDMVEAAGLTEFELAVVEAGQENAPGWKSKVALENVNPKTNKPYTRAAVKAILEKAYSKMRKAA